MYIDRYRLTIVGDNILECEFLMEDHIFKQVKEDIFDKLKADGPYAPRIIIRNLSLEEREEAERKRIEEEKRRQEEIESQKAFAEMCSHLGMWKLGDNPKIKEALEAFRDQYGMTEELPIETIKQIEEKAQKDIEYLESRLSEKAKREQEKKASYKKFLDKVADLTSGMADDLGDFERIPVSDESQERDHIEYVKCDHCGHEFKASALLDRFICPNCGNGFGAFRIKVTEV